MAESLLAFDPGGVTGWSYWTFDDTHPMQRLEFGLIKGGAQGFLHWLESHLIAYRPDVLVCERFNTDDGRSGRADLVALYCEGILMAVCHALGIEIIWQTNGMKALVHDRVLRENGLWILGPDVDHADGRDVNDSEIHALAWAKSHDHEPTVAAYWPEMP